LGSHARPLDSLPDILLDAGNENFRFPHPRPKQSKLF